MSRTSVRYSLCFLVLSVACATSGIAQTSTATVTGTVRDSTGAVVPSVTVTVTSAERGTSQSTVSNEAGIYVVPVLNPGRYWLAAEMSGFKKFLQEGLELQVNQTVRIDVNLQVGGTTETVQVSSAAPLLETDTSSRGSVIDGKKIVELPLNGRDYNQLALLSPGVLPGTPRLASVNSRACSTSMGIAPSTTSSF
jgi:hypothetical protein